jgi:nicotinamide-nucleotide adenylyltransferase
MSAEEGRDRLLQVRGWEGCQGLGASEGDLGCPGPAVGLRIAELAPGPVAARAHAGHRIRVDQPAIPAALLRSLLPGAPRLEILGAPPDRPASVGLLSGSFDPMTVAHAALAEALRAHAPDLVLLVYSPRTMPKGAGAEPPLLTPQRRVASVAAWCARRAGFEAAICSHGLYADQVDAAAASFPGADIVVGLGTDKVLQLFDPRWYEDREAALAKLFDTARVAYAARGSREAAEVASMIEENPRWAGRLVPLRLPYGVRDVSSGDVRRRLRGGGDARSLVPDEIVRFLATGAG